MPKTLPGAAAIAWLGAALVLVSVAAPAVAEEPGLVVHPLQGPPVQFSIEKLRELGEQEYTAESEKGASVKFSCVPVASVLIKAGVEFGKSLGGERMQEFLLVKAQDDYGVVFALAELDPAFTDKQVLLCDASNGSPLSAKEGPLRLVVPGEKRHARWVRQVTDFFIKSAK